METGTAITLPGVDPAPLPTTREERGREIAERGGIRQIGGHYAVPSQTPGGDAPVYIVDIIEETCSCPDHELRGSRPDQGVQGVRCKHVEAVWFWIAWEGAMSNDGDQKDKPPKKRKTYSQNWNAYDEAQMTEKERMQVYLKELCSLIEEAERPDSAPGRPPIPMRDRIYAILMKVYTTLSSRRSATDIRRCAQDGHIDRAPHYSRINRYLQSEETTPILLRLVAESARPLAQIENDRGQFAADSSGISTVVYDRWFDQKHGKLKAQHAWVKLNMICGTATHVIVAAKVGPEADCPVLPELIDGVPVCFHIKEVSADKAYLANYNVEAIHNAGATPFIAFKSNSVGLASKNPLWRKMWLHFSEHTEDFLKGYHRRSNAETVFWMMKSKFCGRVRSKLPTAQVNEVLAMVVLHNVYCVIKAAVEFKIEVEFKPQPVRLPPELTLVP